MTKDQILLDLRHLGQPEPIFHIVTEGVDDMLGVLRHLPDVLVERRRGRVSPSRATVIWEPASDPHQRPLWLP